jgi:hypothetical protein
MVLEHLRAPQVPTLFWDLYIHSPIRLHGVVKYRDNFTLPQGGTYFCLFLSLYICVYRCIYTSRYIPVYRHMYFLF